VAPREGFAQCLLYTKTLFRGCPATSPRPSGDEALLHAIFLIPTRLETAVSISSFLEDECGGASNDFRPAGASWRVPRACQNRRQWVIDHPPSHKRPRPAPKWTKIKRLSRGEGSNRSKWRARRDPPRARIESTPHPQRAACRSSEVGIRLPVRQARASSRS
jgi:hypothetical protein